VCTRDFSATFTYAGEVISLQTTILCLERPLAAQYVEDAFDGGGGEEGK